MNMLLFLLSFSLCAFQVLISVTLAAAFAGQSMFLLLAPPFFAMALAGFFVAIWPRALQVTARRASLWAFASLPVSMLALRLVLDSFDLDLQKQMYDLSFSANYRMIITKGYDPFKVPVALALVIPFFFYAFFLTQLFKETAKTMYARLISIEVAGSACGLIGASFLLDATSWPAVATVLLFAPMLGLVPFLKSAKLQLPKIIWSLVGILFATLTYLLAIYLEPVSNPHIAVKDFRQNQQVNELERSWTTFSKVQTFEIKTPVGPRKLITLNNGMGFVQLTQYPYVEPPQIRVASVLQTPKTLVLFAGAGSELFALDRILKEPRTITGVELNPRVIQQGLADSTYGLSELLNKSSVQLHQSDARVFLENSSETYNLIIYSWSGATIWHYSGVAMHTTQYSFTTEGFKRALERLEPNGVLIILGASKLNVIQSLKKTGAFAEPLSQSLLLYGQENNDWKVSWDQNLLLVKKGVWSNDEVKKLTQAFEFYQIKPLMVPDYVHPKYEEFSQVVQSINPEESLLKIKAETGLVFHDSTDDRPFVYNVNPDPDFLSIDFYKSTFQQLRLKQVLATPLNFSAFLFLVLLGALTLSPYVLRESNETTLGLLVRGLVFCGLGISYGLFQLYLIFKFNLFIGNPTWAAVAGLGTFLCAYTAASLILQQKRISSKTINMLILAGFVFWILAEILVTDGAQTLFKLSLPLRLLTMVSCFFMASLCTSLLFPRELARGTDQNQRSAPWWFGLDALACALAVSVGPLAIERYGVAFALNFGLAIYGLSFILINLNRLRRSI